ncbi:hypothetical protein [Parasediminibacterium sp. JCM 36343]|uniref:hypothetical protein n=1 Tax=Parasediminibacterium sp. JCM 36343 TaxID=3374279 RepID=UPI00397D9B90
MSSQIVVVDIVKKSKDFFFFLLSKWALILAVSLLAAVAAIVYTWRQDPKYSATMTFVAESETSSGLGGYASLAAQFGVDVGGSSSSAFSEDNLVELLKSRLLIDKTLLSPFGDGLLIDKYIANHKINEKLATDTALSKINFATIAAGKYNRATDSVFNAIANGIIKSQIDVDRIDKKLDIIYIKMTDIDMLFAKKFVEMLASNAILFYTDYKTRKNLANVAILQRQTDSVKRMLFGDISDIASIVDLNVNPIKQTLRTNGQKRQIDLQVNTALYTELLKNLEISKLTLRKETPLIQVIDVPKLPLKNEKKGRFLMGLLGAILGAIITSVFLLIKKWIVETA